MSRAEDNISYRVDQFRIWTMELFLSWRKHMNMLIENERTWVLQ